MPVCWIIAGPNGAGKTTFAMEYLPGAAHCNNFINADLIAAGLSPLVPEKQLIAARAEFFYTSLKLEYYKNRISLSKLPWRGEVI